MESEDFKNVFLTVLNERIVETDSNVNLLLHKGGLSRDDFLGVLKVNLGEHTSLIVLDVITCLAYVGL